MKHKPENARLTLQAAEYDAYNRIETSLIDLPAALNNRRAIRDIRALAVRQGAAAVGDPDAPLPVFASEVGSRVYQRNNPLRRREDLLHKQMRGVGPREGSVLSQMLGSNFQNFDFYPNWQNVLGKDFISPIAEGGRGTYDYELQDSVFVGKDFCYKLAVTPKRSHDLAFKGTIWITTDGYALRRADLVASPEANINFVNDLRVSQELDLARRGRRPAHAHQAAHQRAALGQAGGHAGALHHREQQLRAQPAAPGARLLRPAHRVVADGAHRHRPGQRPAQSACPRARPSGYFDTAPPRHPEFERAPDLCRARLGQGAALGAQACSTGSTCS